MTRDEIEEWVYDQALAGGRRHWGAAVPVSGDWWALMCKDALTVRPN